MPDKSTRCQIRIAEYSGGEPHELDIDALDGRGRYVGWFLRLSPGYPFGDFPEPAGVEAEFRANAAKIVAAWNAIESAAALLGCDALALAEALRDGGIARMAEAARPFAAFADPRRLWPAGLVITPGSATAKPRLTMGDCYAADAALAPIGALAGKPGEPT